MLLANLGVSNSPLHGMHGKESPWVGEGSGHAGLDIGALRTRIGLLLKGIIRATIRDP